MKRIICLILAMVLCGTTVFADDALKKRTRFKTWDEFPENFGEGIEFPNGHGIAFTKVFDLEETEDNNYTDKYGWPAEVVKITVAKDSVIMAGSTDAQIYCLSPDEDNWFCDDKYFTCDSSCDGYTIEDLGVEVYAEYESDIKGYYDYIAWAFTGKSELSHLKIKIITNGVYYFDVTILDKEFVSEKEDEPPKPTEPIQKPQEEEKEEPIALVTSFSDVPQKHWAYSAVMNMQKRGLFSGVSAPVNGIGTFAPNKTMSKNELLLVLVSELFSVELKEEQKIERPAYLWWESAYNVALDKGLIYRNEFNDNGVLLLGNDVTREEMAMLLDRACSLKGFADVSPVPSERIPDYNKINKKYTDAVRSVYSRGFIAGIDDIGTFNPKGVLTRAQAAVVLDRFVSAK
ncbi:MAG: S-layer homology domain-containing protein [Clostridia bacterium]|nr:S-layer homology domain-containing protein [Clostridia bacterium]